MPIAQAYSHFIPVLLIVARLSGFVAFAPVFDSSAIPMRVKLSLVLILGVVFHFGFGLGLGAEVPLDSVWPLVGLLIKEFAVGTVMSLTMIFIFSAFSYAGSLIAPQMGLAVSQLLDPQTQSMQPLLGTFFGMIGVIFFLAIDGHLLMIRAFAQSYELVPLGEFRVSGPLIQSLLASAGQLFVLGFKISAPVLAVVIFLNVGMAIMARAVPQVNVLVVGFIITISVGFIVLAIVLPQMGPSVRARLNDMLERALWTLKAI